MRWMIGFAALALLGTGCMFLKKPRAGVPSSAKAAGWISPHLELTADGAFAYDAFVEHAPRTSRVDLRLIGPGGRPTSLYEGPPGTGMFGRNGSRPRAGAVSSSQLAPGRFALELALDGEVLAREDFELVLAPTCDGQHRLVVSPAGRVGRPFLLRDALAILVVRRASDPSTLGYRWSWFAGGSEVDAGSTWQVPPHPGFGATGFTGCELATIAMIRVPIPPGRDTRFEAVLASSTKLLGAVAIARGPDYQLVTASPPVRGSGPLPVLVAPSDVARAALEQPLAAQSKGVLANAAKRDKPEAWYCAMFERADARAQVERIRSLQGGAGPTLYDEIKATRDPARRQELERENRKRVELGIANERRSEEARAKLDAMVALFASGCLDAIVPPAFRTESR